MSKNMPKLAMKKTFLLIMVSLLASAIIAVYIFLENTASHYPNADLKYLRSPYLAHIGPYWTLSITSCFSTSDEVEQVRQWYQGTKWIPFGDALLFPRKQIGNLCFEKGNEYTWNWGDVEPEFTEIYHLTNYRVGQCIPLGNE
ncbi:hypothetical protein ACFLYP_02645 [Chloroflexota bacterium]